MLFYKGGFIKTLTEFCIQLLIGAIVLELILALFLYNTGLIPILPAQLQETLRYIYYGGISNDVQFDAECSHYDPELTYLLKNHLRTNESCEFTSPDFSTTVRGNRAGLRGGEEALEAPEIIVIGDSWSFGWGVEEEESYPTLLQEKLGTKVLNASIPSYGTVRELKLLKKQDLSNVKTLLIQYCNNDFKENLTALSDGKLQITSKEEYEKIIHKVYPKSRTYYPLKYFGMVMQFIWEKLSTQSDEVKASPSEVFLETIKTSLPTFSEPINIILYELSGPARAPHLQRSELSEEALKEAFSPHKVTFLTPEESLDPSDYFPLDKHLKAKGHVKVAEILAEELREGANE